MQTQFNNFAELSNRLKQMIGIEYIVSRVQLPILFVIQKQDRRSETEGSQLEFLTPELTASSLAYPMASYYVLDGRVFQAPDLYSVVTSRLLNGLKNVQLAADACRSRSWFHPNMGYQWRHPEPEKARPTFESDGETSMLKPEGTPLTITGKSNKCSGY